MLLKKRPLTKWSYVVLRNSCSTLSTTSDKARQIIGWTLVCVSIHLECWLDKARAKNRYLGCSGCGMPTAIQLQFCFKILAVWMWSMWIEFTFDAHQVNVNSIRIQTESSVKRPYNACVLYVNQTVHTFSSSLGLLQCYLSSPLRWWNSALLQFSSERCWAQL